MSSRSARKGANTGSLRRSCAWYAGTHRARLLLAMSAACSPVSTGFSGMWEPSLLCPVHHGGRKAGRIWRQITQHCTYGAPSKVRQHVAPLCRSWRSIRPLAWAIFEEGMGPGIASRGVLMCAWARQGMPLVVAISLNLSNGCMPVAVMEECLHLRRCDGPTTSSRINTNVSMHLNPPSRRPGPRAPPESGVC